MRAWRGGPVIPKAGSGVCDTIVESLDRVCIPAGLEGVMSKGQKYNPAWPDTKEGRTERSAKRRARLREILATVGWKSESEYLTAILDGVIEAQPKPAAAPQPAQKEGE